MKKRLSTAIFIIIFTLLDQISKYFFYDNAFLENTRFFDPSFNTGISRSLPVNIILVIILTIIISTLIIIWYKKNYIWKRATIFLIWWTLGNLIDRIFLWWVRDFILVFKRFPVFNLADTFICTWAALIIIKELFLWHNKKK
jgi:lipoprotein signal peptidase